MLVTALRCWVIFILYGSILATNPLDGNKYRNDYVFSPITNAFYKLHIDTASYEYAEKICEVEGGKLMVPASHQDVVQFHAMFKRYPDLGDRVWAGDDGQIHEYDEEPAIINLEPRSEEVDTSKKCTVLTRQGEIESQTCLHYKLPFICKVEAVNAVYNERCKVYGSGYNYKENVGSCYKIPRIVYTWDQALEECKAEGAHLVVINSDLESEVVRTLMTSTPYLEDSHSKYYYIAGIRANMPTDGTPRVFRTIFNETLQEAGFDKWAFTEPNNYRNSEYCGSLYESDGKYNDHNCAHVYGFICEVEVHL